MSIASCHRIGDESNFARQRGNEAFSSFLMTLFFSTDLDIFELLSCSKCKRRLKDCSKRMDGIVMDASAIGILGKLPEFERVNYEMNVVSRISDRQYIMRVVKSRSFIDSIEVPAKTSDCRGCFNVLLKKGLWDKRFELVGRFFGGSNNVAHESRSVSRFVFSAF